MSEQRRPGEQKMTSLKSNKIKQERILAYHRQPSLSVWYYTANKKDSVSYRAAHY
jgi:hypothetical protein